MKNTIKVLGIIVLVAIIGFSMAACDDGSKDDNNQSNNNQGNNNQGNNNQSSNPFVGNWSGTANFSGQSAPATINVTATGWTFSCPNAGMNETGTYTRSGNSATLIQSGATFGNATISGNTLTVMITQYQYAGGTGTFTQGNINTNPNTPNQGSNPFVGTWRASEREDGVTYNYTITATDTTFTCIGTGGGETWIIMSGTYTRSGNTATIIDSGEVFTATVSGNTLTIEGMTFTKS